MMWYAVILVCALSAVDADGNCNKDQLVWSAVSPSQFTSEQSCEVGAGQYFRSHLNEFKDQLKEDEHYRVQMECSQ